MEKPILDYRTADDDIIENKRNQRCWLTFSGAMCGIVLVDFTGLPPFPISAIMAVVGGCCGLAACVLTVYLFIRGARNAILIVTMISGLFSMAACVTAFMPG